MRAINDAPLEPRVALKILKGPHGVHRTSLIVVSCCSICATILDLQRILSLVKSDFAMSSYSVRPATPHDAKAIAEIHVSTWQSTYKELMPADFLKTTTLEKRLAYWREAIEYSEPQLLVVLEAETVVGFVGFDRSRDAGTKPSVGEIWALYVAPEHWSKGAGIALWDGARDGLKEEGCTQVTAWVLLRNERAIRFFEHSAGFKREMPSLKTVAFGSTKLEEIRLKRSVE